MSKTYKLQVMLSEEEKAAILEEARQKNMSASQIVRLRVFQTERQERAFNVVKERLLDQARAGDDEALGLILDLSGTTQQRLKAEVVADLKAGKFSQAAESKLLDLAKERLNQLQA